MELLEIFKERHEHLGFSGANLLCVGFGGRLGQRQGLREWGRVHTGQTVARLGQYLVELTGRGDP